VALAQHEEPVFKCRGGQLFYPKFLDELNLLKYIFSIISITEVAMSDFRTVEIDIDVHRRIENERKSFAESPNDVLRRLIGIEQMSEPSKSASYGRPWSGKGVTLPHGTELRMEYNGTVHTGKIEDGKWSVEGKLFGSPSAAAGGVAKTKSGGSPSLDGWGYWYVKPPGNHIWVHIGELRQD
jgi:hypothetical protein